MAETYRTPSEFELSAFRYLDLLNKEGKVGIRPLIIKWPGLTDKDATQVLQWWNQNHNKEGNYELIKISS